MKGLTAICVGFSAGRLWAKVGGMPKKNSSKRKLFSCRLPGRRTLPISGIEPKCPAGSLRIPGLPAGPLAHRIAAADQRATMHASCVVPLHESRTATRAMCKLVRFWSSGSLQRQTFIQSDAYGFNCVMNSDAVVRRPGGRRILFHRIVKRCSVWP